MLTALMQLSASEMLYHQSREAARPHSQTRTHRLVDRQ